MLYDRKGVHDTSTNYVPKSYLNCILGPDGKKVPESEK